jgi:predicted helicase
MEQKRYKETGSGSFYGEYLYDQLVPESRFLRKWMEVIAYLYKLSERQVDTYAWDRGYHDGDNHYYLWLKGLHSAIRLKRNQTMKNFLNHDNIGLIYKRGFIEERSAPVGITNVVSHERTWSRPGMQGADTVAPLYLYHDDGTQTVNFVPSVLSILTENIVTEPTPDEILDYIYAILHSPLYCEKYLEFLKIDFPRIPIPTQNEFDRLVPLGTQLRELHLMKSPIIDEYETTFPVAGDCMVETIKYDGNRVWINRSQYFGNVPELAWNFYIGGYQPAQMWLKDRKGRQLSDHDLVHYQRIIKILLETDRLMKIIG